MTCSGLPRSSKSDECSRWAERSPESFSRNLRRTSEPPRKVWKRKNGEGQKEGETGGRWRDTGGRRHPIRWRREEDKRRTAKYTIIQQTSTKSQISTTTWAGKFAFLGSLCRWHHPSCVESLSTLLGTESCPEKLQNWWAFEPQTPSNNENDRRREDHRAEAARWSRASVNKLICLDFSEVRNISLGCTEPWLLQ